MIENPRLQEKFSNYTENTQDAQGCTFIIDYSISCKRHSASQIIVLQKIFKRATYLHTFICTRLNCARRIPQQLRRMTIDALQSKPACA